MDERLERFCLVLSHIPKGRVCSYGQLAKMADLSNARQSCRFLRQLPDGSQLPWYRIVNAQGQLADYTGAVIQRELLEAEGVCFTKKGRIPKHYFL
jgi:methylated-DNA-protein-cysteine methyltransferase-like protein